MKIFEIFTKIGKFTPNFRAISSYWGNVFRYTLSFCNVNEVIFKNREIRQLQWLLSEYKLIIGDYRITVNDLKSGHLKHLLIKKYGYRVTNRFQIGTSEKSERMGEWCCWRWKLHWCSRLHSEINHTNCIKWHPKINELETEDQENIWVSKISHKKDERAVQDIKACLEEF